MVAGEGGRRLIGRNEGVDYRLRDLSISSTGAMNRELAVAVPGWFDRGRWCSYLEGVICCKRRKDGVWMLKDARSQGIASGPESAAASIWGDLPIGLQQSLGSTHPPPPLRWPPQNTAGKSQFELCKPTILKQHGETWHRRLDFVTPTARQADSGHQPHESHFPASSLPNGKPVSFEA